MIITESLTRNSKKTMKKPNLRNLAKLEILLLSILIMSALDAVFTIFWIRQGLAEEANPILDYFLQFGEESFLAGKFLLTVGGCVILKNLKKHKLSMRAAISLACFYFCIILYHLIGGVLSLNQ